MEGDPIPPSWLKSHGRSLVRYHLHPESKFEGGDYDQRGLLQRRRVRALTVQAIGKESDDLEENKFIGEDAGPIDHPIEGIGVAKIATFVFETQKRHAISDRTLLDRAKVSPHTLKAFREGRSVEDAVLRRLAAAVEDLGRDSSQTKTEKGYWLEEAKDLAERLGGRNKPAKVLGISGPYLGRVLRGEKPIMEELAERLTQSRDGGTVPAGLRRKP